MESLLAQPLMCATNAALQRQLVVRTLAQQATNLKPVRRQSTALAYSRLARKLCVAMLKPPNVEEYRTLAQGTLTGTHRSTASPSGQRCRLLIVALPRRLVVDIQVAQQASN
jgi:hypothetical protein